MLAILIFQSLPSTMPLDIRILTGWTSGILFFLTLVYLMTSSVSSKIMSNSIEQFYEEVSYESFIAEPEKADKDKSGYIDVKEYIALALGLTINNLLSGVGAGISGFHAAITSFFSFVFSLLAITGGYTLGDRFKIRMSRRWTGILSGCLLISLDIYEYFIS